MSYHMLEMDGDGTVIYGDAYNYGEVPPRYPVPAVIRCEWCGSDGSVCTFNMCGCWCPAMCFPVDDYMDEPEHKRLPSDQW